MKRIFISVSAELFTVYNSFNLACRFQKQNRNSAYARLKLLDPGGRLAGCALHMNNCLENSPILPENPTRHQGTQRTPRDLQESRGHTQNVSTILDSVGASGALTSPTKPAEICDCTVTQKCPGDSLGFSWNNKATHVSYTAPLLCA